MYIPAHYAFIVFVLLLAQSSVIFIYTVIGLLKQSPVPLQDLFIPPPMPPACPTAPPQPIYLPQDHKGVQAPAVTTVTTTIWLPALVNNWPMQTPLALVSSSSLSAAASTTASTTTPTTSSSDSTSSTTTSTMTSVSSTTAATSSTTTSTSPSASTTAKPDAGCVRNIVAVYPVSGGFSTGTTPMSIASCTAT